MEEYKDVTGLRLTKGFMEIFNGIEAQKNSLKETYIIFEQRQRDMVSALVKQLELDVGTWEVKDGMLIKQAEKTEDGNG